MTWINIQIVLKDTLGGRLGGVAGKGAGPNEVRGRVVAAVDVVVVEHGARVVAAGRRLLHGGRSLLGRGLNDGLGNELPERRYLRDEGRGGRLLGNDGRRRYRLRGSGGGARRRLDRGGGDLGGRSGLGSGRRRLGLGGHSVGDPFDGDRSLPNNLALLEDGNGNGHKSAGDGEENR
jgi:hypothetical protein